MQINRLSIRAVSALFGMFAAITAPASAALFLDHTGGTSIAFGDTDDGASGRGAWLDAGFFGEAIEAPSYGQVTVSINGHVRFGPGSPNDYDPTFLGTTGVNRIAPMWMDFNLGSNGQVIESFGAGDAYYAVTWVNVENVYHPGYLANFQVILFNANTQLNGVSFGAGDVIFSYGDIDLYTQINEVVIGLESSGGDYAALPGHEALTGWHSYGVLGDFPVGDDQYVLFRPDGAGNYTVSIETAAIPEPSAYAAIVGALALAGLAFRRQGRAARK